MPIFKNIPTILIAFGATGDLMRKKVVPALYYLHKKGELPDLFRVVGFSRREMDDGQFRAYVREMIETHAGSAIADASLDSFIEMFHFQRGDFDEVQAYENLKELIIQLESTWGVCTNKLFYLSVAPEFYEGIFKHLKSSGLSEGCSPEEGWMRVIVEKPFGTDLDTAKKLDNLLGEIFKEEQIYRIDHYLAKEMLQNILNFRFSNNLFELNWDKSLIEKIDIRVIESIGVEKRGAFYDAIGALRDVGQNHFLQMLALITMEQPTSLNARDIQMKRAEVLQTLKPMPTSVMPTQTFRAQYEGYQDIPGVAPQSDTETYFKIRTELDADKWRGVPIYLEGGKRAGDALKEIVITFKHPMPCLCPPDGPHHKNEVIIRLDPKEEILIEFWSKRPGFTMETEPRVFHFLFREAAAHSQYIEEYARLLLDCIRGDQALFVSTDEIRAMWRFTDPILKAWHEGTVPLARYVPDKRIPEQQMQYIELPIEPTATIKQEIAVMGLGKMGGNMARRLLERGWKVKGIAHSSSLEVLESAGLERITVQDVPSKLSSRRIVWLMVPAGKPVDEALFGAEGLINILEKGDIIIDAGNSYYKDSQTRAEKLALKGIEYVDVGFSGGPSGARNGASLMIGGDEATFRYLEPLWRDLAHPDGYQFFAGAGAGHFVKMVHNGIEYGMMQALAEGFAIMEKSKYNLDLTKVAEIYNHGSVIESRLVGWLRSAFDTHGEKLEGVSGTVAHTGEGTWTVEAAKEADVEAKIIEGALQFRIESAKNPSYTGQILSALREQFGGHGVKEL